MSSASVVDNLRALRQDFDHSFTLAADAGRPPHLDFLSVRIAGDAYAIRLSEVASLHADRRLVTVPSLLPELLGIGGFRGSLTPIYDLSALLGYRAQTQPKWLLIAAWPSAIGFAFESLDAHLRISPEAVSAPNATATSSLQGAVKSAERTLPLLYLPSLIEGIAQRIKALGPTQER